MKLLKYAAKLTKMSPRELAFRLKQTGRNQLEQMRWKIRKSQPAELFIPDHVRNWDLSKNPFPDGELEFFGFSADRDVLREHFIERFPEVQKQVKKDADQLLSHKFNLLGLAFELSDSIDWNRNPQTGNAYPVQHHAMMDTFNTGVYGDVKFVWELNRHQFFIEVAKAYFVTRDEKYAEKIWEWFESYCHQVPHKLGINNTSVLEHAVRIFSWVWTFYFTSASQVWSSARRAELVRRLLLEAEMIEENLSYYYSPYNHLIGELAALAFLGTVYPVNSRLRNWRDKYWQEMELQLSKQYHSDGFTVEQATYYHHFTTGFYLQLAILRQQNGLPVSPETWPALEKALEVPMYLTRPDGTLPMIGDIDSARSIYFYQPRPMWDLRAFQSIGAALFKRADMKLVSGKVSEEVLWLLGIDGMATYEGLDASEPEQKSRSLPESGYYLMRDGWSESASFCCFDCGEIAHGVYKDETPSAAHGHGDILSFDLTVNGKAVLIDPGFHTYFGPLDWHREFRSSRGHNAIELNGAGQAIHEGRIGWSNVSSPEVIHWKTTEEFDLVCGRIDRFARIEDPVYHKRSMLFRKSGWFLVMDEILGSAPGKEFDMCSSFHLAPGKATLKKRTVLFDKDQALHLAVPDNASIELKSGGEHPGDGWIAAGYGQRQKAAVLRISATGQLPIRMGLLIPVGDPQGSLEFRVLDHGATCWILNTGEFVEHVYFNPGLQPLVIGNGERQQTSALCSIVRFSGDQITDIHYLR